MNMDSGGFNKTIFKKFSNIYVVAYKHNVISPCVSKGEEDDSCFFSNDDVKPH